jgi:hypothetical protein
MSSLKRKIEIDKLIEDFIGSFRAELERIDNDFCFITEDDDEIHSRLYCLRHIVPVVLPKEEGFNIGDVTETLPNANEYKLRFFGDFCLEGEELDDFFDYIDRVKKEVTAAKFNAQIANL